MKDTLPIFEEAEVRKSTLRITKAGDGLSEALDLEPKALHLGDEVCFVLRGEVVQVNHRRGEDVVIRQHTVEAGQIAEVTADVAAAIIAANAARLAKLRDERDGQEPLPLHADV
jgi:urease accessory protein UreE